MWHITAGSPGNFGSAEELGRVPWDQYVGDVNVVTGNFTPSFTI